MGYFSNGTEGELYYEHYCARCLHDNQAKSIHCPIWSQHLMDNYKECNNAQSYLHRFIPRDQSGLGNGRCVMFVDRGAMSNLQIEHWEHDAVKDG